MTHTSFTRFRLGAAALLLLAGVACAQTSSIESKDDLFQGTEIFAKNATSVTEITMDPDSLQQVKGKDAPSARNTLLNVVRTYSYDKPGQFRMEDVEQYRAKLNTGDWHCSVHTREFKSGSSTDVCAKHRTDDYKETAIITVSPTSLTFIHTIRKKGAGWSGSYVTSDGGSWSSSGDDFLPEMSFNNATMRGLSAQMAMLHAPPMTELRAELLANAAGMRATAQINSAEWKARMQEMMALHQPEMQQSLTNAWKSLHESGTAGPIENLIPAKPLGEPK